MPFKLSLNYLGMTFNPCRCYTEYTPVMDVAILFGTSPGPTADERFAAQRELVKGLVNKYEISKQKTLVSYVSQDTRPAVILKLKDNTDKNYVIKLADSIVNRKVISTMDKNLIFINNTVFSGDHGARDNVPKSILYFVDSKQIGDKGEINEFVERLRASKVKLVIVGQGDSVEKDALQPLAYDKESIFFANNMKDIDRLITPVSDALKPGTLLYIVLMK